LKCLHAARSSASVSEEHFRLVPFPVGSSVLAGGASCCGPTVAVGLLTGIVGLKDSTRQGSHSS